MTQSEAVIKYLSSHGMITSYTAVIELGVLDLPKIICNLQKQGYEFSRTRMHKPNRYGTQCSYLQYKLEGRPDECRKQAEGNVPEVRPQTDPQGQRGCRAGDTSGVPASGTDADAGDDSKGSNGADAGTNRSGQQGAGKATGSAGTGNSFAGEEREGDLFPRQYRDYERVG